MNNRQTKTKTKKKKMMGCAAAAVNASLFPNGLISSSVNGYMNNVVSVSNGAQAHGGYKWRLVIAYDGTKFAGWQYQDSPPTIQSVLEKALNQITKLERKELRLVGAGRTDAGVHAWGQVAHFVTPFNYNSLESIHAALNGLLPHDIRIRERCYAYHCAYKLNSSAMREAADHFVGRHDFSAFANATRDDGVPDPVKTVSRFDVIEMGPLLQLEVEGSGFMYRQVRNMVALLLQIGKEAIPPDIVPMILQTRDRRELAKYSSAVPPHGLCLVSVKYKEDHLQLPQGCPATSFGRHHTLTKCKLPFY